MGIGIPYADRLVFTAAGKNPSTGAKGDRSYPMCMPFHDVKREACADTPGTYCPIFTTTDKNFAVRTESYGSNKTGMAIQNLKAVTCIGIPQANGLVFTAAGKNATIGTEGNRAYSVCMPQAGKEWGNSVCPPQSDLDSSGSGC